MIFLHDYYGFTKYAKKIEPLNFLNVYKKFSLSKEDIKKELIIKEYSLSISGEKSGWTLEFFISSDKKIIYILKFSYISMKELLDMNLWVGNNFYELNKIVNEKIKASSLMIDNEQLNKVLPGFPEENDIIEKVNIIESDIYSSDENSDSDNLRLTEIKIKKNYILVM